MSSITDIVIDLNKYPFSKSALSEIAENKWVKSQWPLVYLIKNDKRKLAYVGETTNAFNRIKNHFANEDRLILNTITLIGSDRFNKSATLDIESQLIQYLSAENTYKLQNGNGGLTHHNYYEKPFYRDIFKEIWSRLKNEKLVSKSIEDIENSDLFKYSPYKALSDDQRASVMEIIHTLNTREFSSIFVEGGAGTGKTILATYLMKLLHSPLPAADEIEDLEGYRLEEYRLLETFHQNFKDAKIALVVPMTSLRKSLKTVFGAVAGLKTSMIISPSDAVKKEYDILIVDEAHRLAQRKNIPNYGSFDATNRSLGLGNEGTQLDWILRSSKHQIFFYDEAQSIKPSDIPKEKFKELKIKSAKPIQLTSQMRVSAGNDYINFVDRLLKCQPLENMSIPEGYDFRFFTSFQDFHNEIIAKEKEFKLSRLIAGYSWPWISKADKNLYDIEIEGKKLQWNNVHIDWINSADPEVEVGCIHTTQGYDLNYTGIIFGKEITYNEKLNRIEIIRENYFDRNGSAGINDDERLKEYIVNIYKTIMYRGIKGTLVYACDPVLRNYLSSHIKNAKSVEVEENAPPEEEPVLRILDFEKVEPYKNAVPLVDIQAAAGSFSENQQHSELTWVGIPEGIRVSEGDFICKVVGESMNKRIPNGSFCLFKSYSGGSRNGKIVLVESTNVQDADFGSGYTVKEYQSVKKISEGEWSHESIVLKPLSTNEEYSDIVLNEDDLMDFRVVGIFERVIE
ncbi:hypothetical protein A33Q_1662 [Indibacter alkaliphilus LW1]|uniref:GIY-YIG domain-containing protein n=1 Tax=Indibacter alkaliphilus (strain CCUG 57479 / KCTC 22604 / LW1) TaxID=1189612 RepID=S2E6F0_INDAL|nr:DNA/RNA helicase domain-containing protein [Indibacter alkaliphilus]EOZ97853.1 hypothetical protein A33Q_1662 [Indibacter alkaliphilus LW1]